MNRRLIATFLANAALLLGAVSAHAGPCTARIAEFEVLVRHSAKMPGAGPMARQTVGAQVDRQPTPGSVEQAEKHAQAAFAHEFARARRLDARGDRAGCARALARAKRMYNL